MEKPRVVIIVQARMGSERLPGKCLLEVFGKPLIAYQIERLQRVKHADEVVIAIPETEENDALADACHDVAIFRGSEGDVLDRYIQAAKAHNADVVVRITGDCPLVDPEVVDQVIAFFLKHPEFDYASNVSPRTWPRGLDVEVCRRADLEAMVKEPLSDAEHEHVTLHFTHHPEKYSLGNLSHPSDLSAHRWTIDTQDDFTLIKTLIETLYPENPNFGMKEILHLFKEKPELMEINAHIEQKGHH